MIFPRRNLDDADTEELTTTDLAEAKRPVSKGIVEVGRPKPVREPQEITPTAESAPKSPPEVALFPEGQLHELQARWDDIQTGFVDEPRSAVQSADSLVAATMHQLAEAFSRERAALEQQWDRGDNISTEDLRMAFQRYRSFFRRLLSI